MSKPVVLVVVRGGVVLGVYVDGDEVDPILLDYDNFAEAGGVENAGDVTLAADRFFEERRMEYVHNARAAGAWHTMINALEPAPPKRLEVPDVN